MDKLQFSRSFNIKADEDQGLPSQLPESAALMPKINARAGGKEALPPALTAFVEQCEPKMAERCLDSAHIILGNEMRTSAGRIDSGRELKARKTELEHGQFERYVRSLGLTMRQAQRWMRVASKFGSHRDTVSILSFDLLHDLSAEDVPQRVRDAVVAKLEAGEYLTPEVIRRMINEAQGEKPGPETSRGDRSDTAQIVSEPSRLPDALTAVPISSKAVASLAQPDDRVVEPMIEPATAGSGVRMTDDYQAKVSTLAEQATELVVGKLARNEILELGHSLTRIDDAEFMCCLRQRCRIAEADAHSVDGELADHAGGAQSK